MFSGISLLLLLLLGVSSSLPTQYGPIPFLQDLTQQYLLCDTLSASQVE